MEEASAASSSSLWGRQSRRILTPLTLALAPYRHLMLLLQSQQSQSQQSQTPSQLVSSNNNNNNHRHIDLGGAAGVWGVHPPHLVIPSLKPPKVGESWWGGGSTLTPSPSSFASYVGKGFGSMSMSRGGVKQGSGGVREGTGEGKGSEGKEGAGGIAREGLVRVHLAGTNFASVAINYTLTFIIERNGQVTLTQSYTHTYTHTHS